MATEINITNTRSIRGGSFTVADLRALIEGVDGSCRVTMTSSADRTGYLHPSHSITINDVKPERSTSSPDGRPFDTL